MNQNAEAAFALARRLRLGGTDIAKIVGASAYGGPYDVFLSKAGQDTFQGNNATRAGKYFESGVAQWYSDQTGRQLHKLHPDLDRGLLLVETGDEWAVQHVEHPFLAGTPDFLTDAPDLGLEIKTAAEEMLYKTDADGIPYWGPDGTDEVPMDYMVQCQWYMGLTGRRRWDLAAFFFGPKREFRLYHLDFDQELFALLIEKGVAFWTGHVEKNVPPPMDLMPSDLVRAHLMNQARTGKVVEATPDLEVLSLDLADASAARKAAEDREDAIKAKLAERMSDLGAQKIEGKTQGAKWSVAIQGGGTYQKVNNGLVIKAFYKRLSDLGVSEEELEGTLSAYTTSVSKTPYIRGYFNSLKKLNAAPAPAAQPLSA